MTIAQRKSAMLAIDNGCFFVLGAAAEQRKVSCVMSTGTSSDSKPRLDIFIPKKLKIQRKTSGLKGQTSPAETKPQSTREAAQDSMNHDTVQMAQRANSCATDQISGQGADKEWTKDQLRLLHRTLTAKLRLADMGREVPARAGSGTAVLQRSSSTESLPVGKRTRLSTPQHSGSALNHEVDMADCSAAIGLADAKAGTVAADTAANGDTTSLTMASMSPASQKSAAHSTGCKSPCDSHRSEPSTSDSAPTAVRHRRGTSLSSWQQRPKQRSDKPARSQRSHKSCRRSRSPKQSRKQTAEHSPRRTGQSSPARKPGRSPSKVKNSNGKLAGSSLSPARGSQALAPTSQSPDRPGMSAAKHVDSNKPKKQTRGGVRKRRIRRIRLHTRRYRSPSRSRSPHLGSRAERIFARPRSPHLATGHFVDTGFMEGQRYAEGERFSPSRL